LPATISALAFDKTGTLTTGHPHVSSVVPLNGHDESELIQRAAALEAHSNHPLARAVLSHAEQLGVDPLYPEDLRTIGGKGAEALVLGRRYRVGSPTFMNEWEQSNDDVRARAKSMGASGETIVAVGSESHVCGLIGLKDRIRSEARDVIDDLHEQGIATMMLTGDSPEAAGIVGRALGFDRVFPQLLPDQKVALIDSLSSGDDIVAMVGDGVNDAPAMARSNIGIAMGGVGSDVALETSDIVLMSDDLKRIPWLIRHSRRTRSVVRSNIALAIVIKAIVFGATLAGFASLWAAIVADIGATLIVTSNALRLLRPTA
jgi:Cd2+/Zn2+-exporting ATPase